MNDNIAGHDARFMPAEEAMQVPMQPQPMQPMIQEDPKANSRFSFGKFTLESDMMQEAQRQAEAGAVQPFVNPLNPPAPTPEATNFAGQPNFDTPTAKLFHWKTNPYNQEIVDHFANCLGLGKDALAMGDYTSAQRFLNDALTFANQLDPSDGQTAILNYKDAKQQMKRADAWGAKLIDQCNEKDQMVPVERNAPRFIAQMQLAAAQEAQAQQSGAAPNTSMVPAKQPTLPMAQDPTWKKVLSNLPVVGPMAKKMPNHSSMYDSTLNALLGQNWEKWKSPITYSLLGGGALATYYFLVRPMLSSATKPMSEEDEISAPRRRNRKKPSIKRKRTVVKSRPKVNPFKSEEKSSQPSKPKKKRKRRKKKKTTGFEFPQFPDFNLGG